MSTTITGTTAIALAALLVAGCAPLPMADAGSAAQAKTFTPSPDRANVYLYRNQYLGGAIRMAITVDGKEMGITRGKTYVILPLEPGKHTLVSQGQTNLPLTLVVAAGKNYFVRQAVTHNFFSFTYHSRLQLVDEATGRQGIDECELVAPAQ
jgi:hypothetical protein